MKRRLISGALLVLAALESGASVIYREVPLLEAIRKADVVVHARISRIEPRTFNRVGRASRCGTDYFIHVLETFKGRLVRDRSFSFVGDPHAILHHTVKAGDEMLLLLRARGTGERPEGGFVDVVEGRPSRAERACLSSLSLWTLQFSEAGGFPLVTKRASPTDETPEHWLVYTRSRTLLPEALQFQQEPFNQYCKGEECERASRRMVPWLPLRAEIRRFLEGAPSRAARDEDADG